MKRIKRTHKRLILVITTICAIGLFITLQKTRADHTRTLFKTAHHIENTTSKIQAFFSTFQSKRIPSSTELQVSAAQLNAALSSLYFLEENKSLITDQNAFITIETTLILLSQLKPLVQRLSDARHQLNNEQRAQTLLKNNIMEAQKVFGVIFNNLLSAKTKKRDLSTITHLNRLLVEILAYQDLALSIQYQDPIITAAVHTKIQEKTEEFITTPLSKDKISEPRIKSQLRQIQYKLKKITKDNSASLTDELTIQSLTKTLHEIQQLKTTPEKLGLTTLSHTSKTPFYYRPQFQFIHTILIFILVFRIGATFQQPSKETGLSDEQKRQQESIRKKQLMEAIRLLELSQETRQQEGQEENGQEQHNENTKVMPVDLENNELDVRTALMERD